MRFESVGVVYMVMGGLRVKTVREREREIVYEVFVELSS